jgi:hypothetical protein
MQGLNVEVVKDVFKNLAERGYGKLREDFVLRNGKKITSKPIMIFERITFEEFISNLALQDLPLGLNI